MTPIPPKIRKEIDADLAYKTCMLYGQKGHSCGGRITMEHAIIFAGKQLQEKWAIISVCASGQEVDEFQDAHTMDKKMNIWCALNRATDQELQRISKARNYQFERTRLNAIYGPYAQIIPPQGNISALEQAHATAGPTAAKAAMWYPVSPSVMKKIQALADFNAEFFDVFPSSFDIIYKCIDKEFKAVEEIKTNPKYRELLESSKNSKK